VIGLPVLALYRTCGHGLLEDLERGVALACIALVASRDEVFFVVRSPARERLDMIDDGAEVVEQRSPIATPPWMVIREFP
jgi:hypothetical protein